MFARILLPVDGSENSRRAVPVAAELANIVGARVIVFHSGEWEPGALGPKVRELPMEAAGFAEAIADGLTTQGIDADHETQTARSGQVAGQIVEVARRREADLIVMGSRGLSDLGSLVVGSVTHAVLQSAECPVLVVR